MHAGVTSFDTADNYGPSETLVGQWQRLYPHHSRSVVATKLSFMAPGGGGGGGGGGRSGVSRDMVEYRWGRRGRRGRRGGGHPAL